MALLKIIEWKDDTRDTIVYRINCKNDNITRDSKLIVREGQAAVFCDKGKMYDVFEPGTYNLKTTNIPLLTKAMSWKYGFQSPFKSDIYFVNTRQFTNFKWGTSNPIIVRDKDYGAVRIRAYGTYSFKVDDPYIFMRELSGTLSIFKTSDITDWLRSIVVTRMCDCIGESKIPVLDMAGNLVELGKFVCKELKEEFEKIGLVIGAFNFENFSLPEALEKTLDESASLGILRQNMDVYKAKAEADALKEAAKNPGMAGGTMGAGLGFGMGMNMARMYGGQGQTESAVKKEDANTIKCPGCKATIAKDSKFCPECGKKIVNKCPKCGHEVKPGARFCPECGERI